MVSLNPWNKQLSSLLYKPISTQGIGGFISHLESSVTDGTRMITKVAHNKHIM